MGVTMRSTLGLSTPPSFLPYMSHLDNVNPAPIWQRAQNLLLHILHIRNEHKDMMKTTNMYRKHFGYDNKFFSQTAWHFEFRSDFLKVEEIARGSDVVFVATDELLELPAPTLSNIVHIGGLGIENGNITLDTRFSDIMNKSNDVIFFSLGTIANTTKLPTKMMENVLRITQKFKKYQFIIKVDKTDKVAGS